MSDLKSYTSHNFDAVNDQIKQISRREKARTFAYWIESFRTIFLYAALVAFIIVILMLAFSWAHRIINAPYAEEKIEVVRPEIIEKEVLRVVQVPVEKSILETTDSGYKGPTNQPAISSTVASSSTPVSVVTNYNQFNTANVPEFSAYGFSSIITGYRYKDSESNYPEYQYCYFNKSTAGRTTRIRADIAAINEDGVYESYVDSRLAMDVGITQKVLNEALFYCAWATAN